MNNKRKYAIGIAFIGLLAGIWGEMFPESLKKQIEDSFPFHINISFEWFWAFGIIVIVFLSIGLVWKYEKEESLQPPVVVPPNNPYTTPIPSNPQTNTTNMTKEQILSLINEDIDKAFEVLDGIFGKKNATYNVLCAEYQDRPRDFSMSGFISRLKRFVSSHL
jgi:hypothetical protein